MLRQFSRQEKSWIMYDWANSAYSTIITAAILPVFFQAIAVSDGLSETRAASFWGYATSASALCMAVMAPVLGGLANFKGLKMKLFCAFFSIGVVTTAAMFFPMGWQPLLFLYAASFVGWSGSALFYDTFLVDVTTGDRADKVSSFGFGMGYIGGSTIPFVLSIALVQFGDRFGVDGSLAARISFLMAAVWWAVFSIPFIRDVKQVFSEPRRKGAVAASLRGVWEILKSIRQYEGIFVFLLAYFFYIDGVNTVIHMATIYGATVGLDAGMMIVMLLVLQIIAFPFAILYGSLAKRFGGAVMIFAGIITYCVICLIGFVMTEAWQFWVLAALVGSAQGGIQAISRSYFVKLVPTEKANAFFGFYDIFGKFASILGPFLFGISAEIWGARYGVLSLLVLFILGGGIFIRAHKLNRKVA